MIKKLLFILFVFSYTATYAQTIKTDIIIIGANASGTAAAIQGARSRLKTLLVESGPQLCPGMASQTMVTLASGNNLPSGIWGEFRKHIKQFYKATPGQDTAYNAPLRFEPYTASAIIKKFADTVKNLTIKLNTQVSAPKKDGDFWDITITQDGNKQLVKARVIIDATDSALIAKKLGLEIKPFEFKAASPNIYRTSIATGNFIGPMPNTTARLNMYPPSPAYCIPLNAVAVKGADNLLAAAPFFPGDDIQNLPNQLTLGQGLGATAAFCAFFKTTTQKLNVRTIQGELLDFKSYLIPFADIDQRDPYFRAMQQVGATGLLKGVQNTNGSDVRLLFMPDSAVNTNEVESIFKETYSRAFLWFNREKPGTMFTVGNLLSFISEITLTDPKTLETVIQKEWKTQYHFTSSFDMKRPATRREFAILANKFLNPFARTVDLNGRLVN